MDFCKKSPARSRWAMSEALKKTGGHCRKEMKAAIESNEENWPPLHPISERGRTPLYNLGKMISFKYGTTKGIQRLRVGFLGKRAKLARELGYGKRIKVTEAVRKYFHRRGYHLQKKTKTLQLPARPIIDPYLRKNERSILRYTEKQFFAKFFSKERPTLGM